MLSISIYGVVEGVDEITVNIVNLVGERVFSLVVPSYDGAFSEELHLNKLVPGFYFVEVSDGQNVWTRKIVKSR
ncbi:MAG: T9SS type A sorting domain-containing protein [Flavobacteriales bacterium]|nr:T9SS type A sorting domain-containing protein [Flavobacteriales bacterium]